MAEKIKDGKPLERLVAIIERAVADRKDVTVEGPKWLIDKTNGEPRQHDVVLTVKQEHHTFVMAIECRDRSRAVGGPEVEGFHQKCRDTGVDKGVIVSTRGFRNAARRKAKHHGIVCLDMEQVASFNWIGTPEFQQATRTLLHSEWRFVPERNGVVDVTSGVDYLDEDGNELTSSFLKAKAVALLNEHVPPPPLAELFEPFEPFAKKEHRLNLRGTGVTLRNRVTGETVPAASIKVRLEYSETISSTPIRLMRYVDKATSDGQIAEAAVAELAAGDHAVELVMVRKEGKPIELVLTAPFKKKGAGLVQAPPSSQRVTDASSSKDS